MNEEEKKAIERLKEIATNTYAEGKARTIDTILNLIAKLQKENEELKLNNEKYIIHLTDEQYKTVIENAQNDINQKWIQKVKENLIEYQKEYELLLEHQNGKESNKTKTLRGRMHMCQELIEGRK